MCPGPSARHPTLIGVSMSLPACHCISGTGARLATSPVHAPEPQIDGGTLDDRRVFDALLLKPACGVAICLVAALLLLGSAHAVRNLTRIVFYCALLMPLAANADPLVTMDEVGAAIMSCWNPPVGVEKSTVTLVFSFKSDGSLVGPPTSTFVNVAGDDQIRQHFIAAAVDAVDQCTPVELSPTLAEGIGGSPFTMQFSSSYAEQSITPSN